MTEITRKPKILLADQKRIWQPIVARLMNSDVNGDLLIMSRPDEVTAYLSADRDVDLILLDAQFDNSQSSDWLKRLASPERQSRTPVIVLVPDSTPGPGVEETMLDLGASDVWNKDTPEVIMASRIRAQLRRKWAGDRLERLTRERDEFATTVLTAITAKKDGIVSEATSLINYLNHLNVPFSTAQVLSEVERSFSQLEGIGNELTSFAAQVIQARKTNS